METRREIHALQVDLQAKITYISKLETRLTEKQMEFGANAAKLADLQKFRVRAGLIDHVLSTDASEMEYEDMKTVLNVII